MREALGIYTTGFGFGLPSDGIHGPNEKCALCFFLPQTRLALRLAWPLTRARIRRYQLSQMRLGGRAYVLLLHRLAEHARNDGAREDAAEAGVRTPGSDEL